MIWLTDSALKYANEMCRETPHFNVGVFTTHDGYYSVKPKAINLVRNKDATYNESGAGRHLCCLIHYGNGSEIKIAMHERNDRDAVPLHTLRHYNLIIADPDLDDEQVNNTLRPLEYAERPNVMRAAHDIEQIHIPDRGTIDHTFGLTDRAEATQAGGFIPIDIPDPPDPAILWATPDAANAWNTNTVVHTTLNDILAARAVDTTLTTATGTAEIRPITATTHAVTNGLTALEDRVRELETAINTITVRAATA